MREGESAGAAGPLWTVALIAGMALVLVAGAFASGAFLHPQSDTTSGGSTQVESTQVATPTSSSGGKSTTTSTSQTGSSAATLTTSSSATSSATASSSSSSSSAASKTASSSSTTTSTSTQPGSVQVVLPADVGNNESLNFQPAKIKVVIGVNNTVVWTDQDYVQHTVKSVAVPSGAKTWDSGILNEGQTFTLVLTVPGTYRYVCSIHPDWMIGTIQVVQ